MPTFRFSLDAITCLAKAGPEEYADTLTVSIGLFVVNEHEEADGFKREVLQPVKQIASPLGSRGPRFEIYFQPGGTHRFVRNDFTIGTDLDWVLEWDIPKDDTRQYVVQVAAVNDRDVSDPYLLTKVLLGLGVAGAGLVGTAVAGKVFKQGLALILAEIGLKAAEFGLDKLIHHLLEEWPDCAGFVYQREWKGNAAGWGAMTGRRRAATQHAIANAEGCGMARYEVDVAIELVEQSSFARNEQPASRTWLAMEPPGLAAWLGDWYDANAPAIGVGVAHAQAGGLNQYVVTVRETLRNTATIVVEGRFDPIVESRPFVPMWDGEVIPGPTPPLDLGKVVIPDGQPIPTQMRRGGGFGTQGPGAAPGPAPVPAPGPGAAVPGPGAVPRGMRWPRAARLEISAIDVTLMLYEEEQIFAGGHRRLAGPFIRYTRKAGAVATAADLMLARLSPVR